MAARVIKVADSRPRGPFLVQLQPVAGAEYFSVRDGTFGKVPLIDDFLRALRRDESRSIHTTRAYAYDLKLFLEWCQDGDDTSPLSLVEGLEKLGRFKTFLRQAGITVRHSRRGSPRSAASRKRALAAVRAMASYGIDREYFSDSLTKLIWRPDGGQQPNAHLQRLGRTGPTARHNEHVPRASEAKAARQDEYDKLLDAWRNERDLFLIILLAHTGLRIGEAVGLRLSDMHMLMTADGITKLSDECGFSCNGSDGPHLHVIDRPDNANDATSKGTHDAQPIHRRIVVVGQVVEEAYATYLILRNSKPACKKSDSVFVNVGQQPLGRALTARNAALQMEAMSKRAGLDRIITPHMLRHYCGMNLMRAGASDALIGDVLGHKHKDSTKIYARATAQQQREAVDAAYEMVRSEQGLDLT